MLDNFSIYLERIVEGLPFTVWATVGGIALTVALALIAGAAMLAKPRWMRFVARFYVEFFRGTSEVVQLMLAAIAVPIFLGISLGGDKQLLLLVGIAVLGLNHGAYGAEIVRGAIQSVPKGQIEAAIAINLTPMQRLRRVILPQAVVEMVPSFSNLFIQLLKGTALLSMIAVPEMYHKTSELRSVPQFSGDLFVIFAALFLAYLLLAVLITMVMRVAERFAAQWAGRPSSTKRQPKVMVH